jgi:hypothetical protein
MAEMVAPRSLIANFEMKKYDISISDKKLHGSIGLLMTSILPNRGLTAEDYTLNY